MQRESVHEIYDRIERIRNWSLWCEAGVSLAGGSGDIHLPTHREPKVVRRGHGRGTWKAGLTRNGKGLSAGCENWPNPQRRLPGPIRRRSGLAHEQDPLVGRPAGWFRPGADDSGAAGHQLFLNSKIKSEENK